MPRLRAALAAAACAALIAPAAAGAQEVCTGTAPGAAPPPEPGGAPLRFGIYPLGLAGQVGPPADPVPDDFPRKLAALDELRAPGALFVIHLYRSYLSDRSDAREERRAEELVELFRSRGFGVEYVVRFRRAGDVGGYTDFLRGVVRRFGARLDALQVTNEVNFTVSPDSSDGSYEGARQALIEGVIAAKDEARRLGLHHLEIGFNWLYRTDTRSEQEFWGYLRDHGGERFVSSLDYVGLDAYPGTFFPPGGAPPTFRESMINALSLLRECYLPIAGIPRSVPIHVQENGYPTGPGRSYETQRDALEAMIGAVNDYRASYNVSDYRWFGLRDADSASPNFQQQYGLMRDDYTPKPAFEAYRRRIDELSVRGAEHGAPAAARRPRVALRLRCYRRGIRARLAGRGVGEVASVEFVVRGRRARDSRRPFRRRIRLARARARGRVRVRARVFPSSGRGFPIVSVRRCR